MKLAEFLNKDNEITAEDLERKMRSDFERNFDVRWNSPSKKMIKGKGLFYRYPEPFAARKEEYTILKHIFIYDQYKRIVSKMRFTFPELVDFMPKNYYYTILSSHMGLSRAYLCTVITSVASREAEIRAEARRLKNQILEDEYQKYKQKQSSKAKK